MSIRIISQAASIDGLEDHGIIGRPLSQPPCKVSGIEVALAGAGNNQTGLWECEPGRFERNIVHAEVMHILRGAATFTPTDGTPVEFGAGDSLFFPANTTGVWHVTETLRKLYVVFDPGT